MLSAKISGTLSLFSRIVRGATELSGREQQRLSCVMCDPLCGCTVATDMRRMRVQVIDDDAVFSCNFQSDLTKLLSEPRCASNISASTGVTVMTLDLYHLAGLSQDVSS